MKHQPRHDPLTDLSLCAEIELLSDLILAVGHANGRLSDSEIDLALGVTGSAAAA